MNILYVYIKMEQVVAERTSMHIDLRGHHFVCRQALCMDLREHYLAASCIYGLVRVPSGRQLCVWTCEGTIWQAFVCMDL